jgi:hypothetical protein
LFQRLEENRQRAHGPSFNECASLVQSSAGLVCRPETIVLASKNWKGAPCSNRLTT